MKKHMNRPGNLTLIGAILFLAATFVGFILFALVAAVVGENLLENDKGLTLLGGIVFYLPYAASVLLIVYDFFLRKKTPITNKFPVRKIGFSMVIMGTCLVLFGFVSLLSYDQNQGANIGAGFLIFGGGLIFIIGFLLVLIGTISSTIKDIRKREI